MRSTMRKFALLAVLTGAIAVAASAQSLTITTLAGPSEPIGWYDGTGSAARFNSPYGVAVDGSSNVYVADQSNHTIRRVTPAGVVTTLAGLAGFQGSADGTGGTANFYFPTGVAVEGTGNVLVADYYNHTIRKITPAGVVTTPAGLAGAYGSTDGTGSAARFYNPTGVAVDGGGNVYVADSFTNTVRKGVAALADVATIDLATAQTGQLRQLDTAPQTATQWLWAVVTRPGLSTAALSGTGVRNPTFTPDAAGTYTFRLFAEGASGASISFVTLTVPPGGGGGGGGGGGDDDGACSTGGTRKGNWLRLLGILAAFALATRSIYRRQQACQDA